MPDGDANRRGNPDWASVAAQVVPEEGGVLPMREYLEKNLSRAQIEPYWGRVPDLVGGLAAAIGRVRGDQLQPSGRLSAPSHSTQSTRSLAAMRS